MNDLFQVNELNVTIQHRSPWSTPPTTIPSSPAPDGIIKIPDGAIIGDDNL